MSPKPAIIQALKQLGDRTNSQGLKLCVTVGDVATKAGININLAEQELLTLATAVGGHLQVAQTGEIVYLFPKNLRAVLLNKFLRLQSLGNVTAR